MKYFLVFLISVTISNAAVWSNQTSIIAVGTMAEASLAAHMGKLNSDISGIKSSQNRINTLYAEKIKISDTLKELKIYENKLLRSIKDNI